MAKIQLSADTLSPERRKPGFALLKVSGWSHAPEQTQMAVQRSEDEKYLGINGEWAPIPVWQSLDQMAIGEDGHLVGDVGPALVDPIVNALHNSYRVTLRSGSETETRTMKIESAVLASSASGSAPDSSELAEGFILGKEAAVATVEQQSEAPAVEHDAETTLENHEEVGTPTAEAGDERVPRFFARNKAAVLIALTLLLLGLAAGGAAWFFLGAPGGERTVAAPSQDAEPANGPVAEDGTSATSAVGGDEKLSDLQLLQRFMATRPDNDAVLAKAQEWQQSNHCDAMLRLLVHNGHKSNDARIALAYATLYDPNSFRPGNCIDKADKDTAIYWYQKAADHGSTEAAELLSALK